MSSRTSIRTRAFATLAAAACMVSLTLLASGAGAGIVATVPLATASPYAVLAGSMVTNTGDSVLDGSIGLAGANSSGTVTGFPPGIVLAPSTIDIDNGPALQAKADLVVAYDNAAGRPVEATTAADLTNLTLQGGVYATADKGALLLSGPLTLDGAGNADSVFIFQTDSSLTTGSASTVTLINGARACNVFWQVGSSATLGENSVFVGNILALTSITVNADVTLQGRALARNGAVTLIDDTFNPTACTETQTTTTTTTTTAPTTPTTDGSTPAGGPAAGAPLPAGPAAGPGGSAGPMTPAAPGSPTTPTGGGGTTTAGRITTSSGTRGAPTGGLARTGPPLGLAFLLGISLVAAGSAALRLGRIRP